MSKILTPFFLLVTLTCHAQRERVYVDLSRNIGKPGDTIWTKAYILQGAFLSNLSENLYIGLYDKRAVLLKQYVFPITGGLSVGEFVIPDSLYSGTYFLSALTKQQLHYDSSDFFTLPLMVYNEDKPGVIHPKKYMAADASAAKTTVREISWISKIESDKISSTIHVDQTTIPRQLRIIKVGRGETAFSANVQLTGIQKERQILFPIDSSKDQEILLLYEDTTLIARQYIPVKEKTIAIQLHADTLNKSSGGLNAWRIETPNSSVFFSSITVTDADRPLETPLSIKLLSNAHSDNLVIWDTAKDESSYSLDKNKGFSMPILSPGSFSDHWEEGAQVSQDMDKVFGMEKAKLLKAAEVKRQALSLKEKLDHKYTSGAFSEQSMYAYDLRTNTNEYNRSVMLYLNAKGGRLYYDPIKDSLLDELGHPIYYFINETECQQLMVKMLNFDNIAYIKVLESDFLSSKRTQTNAVTVIHPNMEMANGSNPRPGDHNTPMPSFASNNGNASFGSNSNNSSLSGINQGNMTGMSPGSDVPSMQQGNNTQKIKLGNIEGRPLHFMDEKTPLNVCIYTRKGNDLPSHSDKFTRALSSGYDKVDAFHPDPIVLFFDASQSGYQFNVRFKNSNTAKRFRLRMEGVSSTGELLHYERIVE